MRRLVTLFLFVFSITMLFNTKVQAGELFTAEIDTTPNDSLLITEVKTNTGGLTGWTYIELTNMGSDTMDMSKFHIQTGGQNSHILNYRDSSAFTHAPLSGFLAPGKSYIFIVPKISMAENPDGSYVYPNNFYANSELMGKADIVFRKDFDFFTNFSSYSVWFNPDDSLDVPNDAYMVDLWNFGPVVGSIFGQSNLPIAGVSGGASSSIFVRKTNITSGIDNATKTWDESRGDDITTSEWLPIPQAKMLNYEEFPFTTIGYHGNTTELNISSSIATINEVDGTITFPYGYRRDSLLRYFDIGLNHAWQFKNNGDTAQYFLQNNDSITFYVPGDSLAIYNFSILVNERPAGFAEVSPVIYKNENGNFVRPFSVSKGFPVDTIGGLPFDVRIDTLLKYIKIEDNCDFEIVYKSGVENNDLKNGDILRVKTKNGDVIKDYRIAVDPYFSTNNTDLKAIIFPGLELWENTETFFYTDTMLDFSNQTNSYTVILPSTVEQSPAVVAVPQDQNARVEILRAKNLKGNEQDRTMKIICTAENDTSVNEITILFIVQRESPEIDSEPFVSDYALHAGNQNHYMMQVYNPNNYDLDMSDYIIMSAPGSWAGDEAISTFLMDSGKVAQHFHRPGFKPAIGENGGIYWDFDPSQTRTFVASQDEYIITTNAGYPYFPVGQQPQELLDRVNFEAVKFNFQSPRTHDFPLFSALSAPNNAIANPNGFLAVLKITDDSIADGTKAVHNFSDYEIVDIVGSKDAPMIWSAWDSEAEKDTNYVVADWRHLGYWMRKPWVYTGNPVNMASMGVGTKDEVTGEITILRNGEWTVVARNANLVANKDLSLENARGRFNNHVMESYVTVPYVLSNTYLVEPGFIGVKNIFGIAASTPVNDFFSNIILLDTAMTVVLEDAQGNPKTELDNIVTGDVLISKNALGTDSVFYTLNVGELDNGVDITSVSYVVTNNGETGEIAGIPLGTTIQEVLDNIVKPDFASLVITNGEELVISTISLTNDTMMVDDAMRGNAIATNGIYFEVIAQNGTNKRVYSLKTESENLIVLSDVYTVNQDEKWINFIDMNTSVNTLLNNLITSSGVTLKVYSNMNFQRSIGSVKFNDRLYAVNEAGTDSVFYHLKFTDEPGEKWGIEVSNKNLEVFNEKLYPNPASSVVTLPASAVSVKVFDITGKMQINKMMNTSRMLDVSNLSKGVYLVNILSDNGMVYTQKLIKE